MPVQMLYCPVCNEIRSLTRGGFIRAHQGPLGGICKGSGQAIDIEATLEVERPKKRSYKNRRSSNRGGVIE